MTITLVLPFPVSVNGMYSNKGRSRIKSPKYGVWCEAAAWALRKQFSGKMITGELMLQIALKPPSNHRRDLDNHAKAIQDALTGVVIRDDSQIKLLFLWWEDNVKGGEARVMIDPISCPAAQSFIASHANRNLQKTPNNIQEKSGNDAAETASNPDISTKAKGGQNA